MLSIGAGSILVVISVVFSGGTVFGFVIGYIIYALQ